MMAFLRSRKPFEKRLLLHPEVLGAIPRQMRPFIWFEEGYFQDFCCDDGCLRDFGGVAKQGVLLKTADFFFLTKITADILNEMKPGASVFAWIHATQNPELLEIARKRKLSLFAMENMQVPQDFFGAFVKNAFHENSEIAGFYGLREALKAVGMGGEDKKILIAGYGSSGYGAAQSALSEGPTEIAILSSRSFTEIKNPLPGVQFFKMENTQQKVWGCANVKIEGVRFLDFVQEYDIFVNCIKQDLDYPRYFLNQADLAGLKKPLLIVDISCDYRIGFDFAEATTIDDPVRQMGSGVSYYAVDNIASVVFQLATRSIATVFLTWLEFCFYFLIEKQLNPLLKASADVLEGVVYNQDYLKFCKVLEKIRNQNLDMA